MMHYLGLTTILQSSNNGEPLSHGILIVCFLCLDVFIDCYTKQRAKLFLQAVDILNFVFTYRKFQISVDHIIFVVAIIIVVVAIIVIIIIINSDHCLCIVIPAQIHLREARRSSKTKASLQKSCKHIYILYENMSQMLWKHSLSSFSSNTLF